MIIVDRPQSQWGEYQGKKFVVGFSWGAAEDNVPIDGWYEVEFNENVIHKRVVPANRWSSLEDARNYVIDHLHRFIDNQSL